MIGLWERIVRYLIECYPAMGDRPVQSDPAGYISAGKNIHLDLKVSIRMSNAGQMLLNADP